MQEDDNGLLAFINAFWVSLAPQSPFAARLVRGGALNGKTNNPTIATKRSFPTNFNGRDNDLSCCVVPFNSSEDFSLKELALQLEVNAAKVLNDS
ncbi:hypothetical protein CEXT_668041 [Caerostris extrusa]|uniref:Uncharacterized protein n=1 Tax=Caerostris extrusa TaxID=172846 RepID=A0AAV4NPH1_CAEEX|nr:hypothetical protein CEXT_668041 [Caerostris extrusa]